MPDPVDWTTITPQSTGEPRTRHLTENARPAILTTWKCVRCNAEQQGPLEQGCTSCGAGKPGRKADPPVQSTLSTSTVQSTQSAAQGFDPVLPEFHFTEWVKQQPPPLQMWIGAHWKDCFSIFEAGMRAQLQRTQTLQKENVSPDTPAVVNTFEARTARTLAAALGIFIEQILQHGPEEAKDGTWLNAEEAKTVLTRLEETNG